MNEDDGSAIGTLATRLVRTTHRNVRRACVASSIACATLVLLTVATASADSLCEGTATRATAAVESAFESHPGAIDRSMPRLVPGARVVEITLYVAGPSDRDGTYCILGGPCYPATAIALSNCTVGPGKPDADGVTQRDLEPIRSKIPAVVLKRWDAENELAKLGLSDARAFGSAAAYARHPTSTCGKLVAAALHGDAAALRTLDVPGETICPD